MTTPGRDGHGRRQRISTREVAARAQVSIGTVSNVLNYPDRVLPATRERVEEAIRELGWVPNKQARDLRAGRSQTIGLAVMDVTNPFFADLLRGANSALEAAGYRTVIGDADNDLDRQQRILHGFLEQRVRGVILGPIGLEAADLDELTHAGINTVLVDRVLEGGVCCTVGVDDVAGGRIAVEHLLERGHRRLAIVGGRSTLAQVRDRRRGAQEAVDAAEASLLSISTDHLDFAGGRRAAGELALMDPHERPTGVFCTNDLVAVGLLQGLIGHGLRVPDDVAIVGYDDIDFAAAAAVPLSSVGQPRRRLGTTAAELLIAEFDATANGLAHVHQAVQFTPELVVRDSSAPAH
ncbi:LacI family DNA-binding transcriptional regulator [Tessaracoccus palaemonis]|uniref:LacI family DNA-binding transcriptional regulator n=1 Tax=Tessaracoccus palaemonis TaxID=2829499 RepID=UPI002103E4F1|nr:LacI family DNA-binding transcriptional regulator [Tessaracoccus palaemonis]